MIGNCTRTNLYHASWNLHRDKCRLADAWEHLLSILSVENFLLRTGSSGNPPNGILILYLYFHLMFYTENSEVRGRFRMCVCVSVCSQNVSLELAPNLRLPAAFVAAADSAVPPWAFSGCCTRTYTACLAFDNGVAG